MIKIVSQRTDDREWSQHDRGFPHQVEIVVTTRPNIRAVMMSWCLGKPYRVVPATPQPGQPARWCFAIADDADSFLATFGGHPVPRQDGTRL